MQARFTASGRSGWYLRVLRPGEVPVDGPITVASTHPSGLTIADANRARAERGRADPDLVAALVAHDRLADEWQAMLADKRGH